MNQFQETFKVLSCGEMSFFEECFNSHMVKEKIS